MNEKDKKTIQEMKQLFLEGLKKSREREERLRSKNFNSENKTKNP